LPPALHETIAAALDPRSRAMLAGSHPALRDSLREFSISDTAVAQGRHVDSLHQLRAMLRDVRSLPPEQSTLRAPPLAVLAGRIGALGDQQFRAAFEDILATILQTPAGERHLMTVPLMMLAGQMALLEPAEQAGALQRLLPGQQPPGSLAPGLHLLAGRLGDLPQAAWQQASAQVLRWAEQLEPDPARQLVEHLPYLPDAARGPAFSGLLQGCRSLPPAPRAERLRNLAGRSGDLSEPDHLQAVRGILAAAGSLAPQQRWAVLKPLCREVYLLPDAEHASIWQAVVRSTLAVPPEQLAAALAQLHDQVRTLRNAGEARQLAVPLMPDVRQELQAWLQPDGALPAEARSTALLMGPQMLYDLPPAERQGLFEQALHSIPQLQEQHRVPFLQELVKAIPALPGAARPPAWQATLQAVEPLAPQQRWAVLEPLGQAACLLPDTERASAWQAVVRSTLAVPPGQQAAAFAQLHDQIKALRNAGPGQRLWVPLLPPVVLELREWPQRGEAPTPEARNAALLMCAQELDDLLPADRKGLFREALRSIPQLRQEHRGPLLKEWAKAIAALPEAARWLEWQDTLWAAGQLPPREGVKVFEPVAAQIGALPLEARAAAVESLLQAQRRLPPRQQGLSVIALGTACVALPRAQWPAVLDRVLDETARIPGLGPVNRAVSLVGLASKFCLAGPAAYDPLAPAPPDRPALDARVRCLDMVLASLPALPGPLPAAIVALLDDLNGSLSLQLQERPDDAAVLRAFHVRLSRLGGA
jgi:hypothetical protein